jgi:CBS domain-containing protein
MTNRKLAYIVKDQKPLVLAAHETVRQACRCMWERRAGSVLVTDDQHRLSGIFTGRDAVRALAEGKDAGDTPLAKAMTPNPVTITPESRAIDALRAMSDGGFRHLPVVEDGGSRARTAGPSEDSPITAPRRYCIPVPRSRSWVHRLG